MSRETNRLETIARTLLYEGYILWPYRRSALKNRHRWTIGGVHPGGEGRLIQAECLLEAGEGAAVGIRLRFLHRVFRQTARWDGAALVGVDELRVGGERYLTWEEGREREVRARVAVGGAGSGEIPSSPRKLPSTPIGGRGSMQAQPEPSLVLPIQIEAGCEEEWLTAPDGERAGALVRSWEALEGVLEVAVQRLGERLHRVSVRFTNTATVAEGEREEAVARAFHSSHLVLEAEGGEFVSLLEPPEALREMAEACRNVACWPVLVGEVGERHTLLASPIILYDYPQIAPESPGDLFDGGEIDHLLILNVLGMTDEEKAEMRASDPRTREILERAEALAPEELMPTFGAIREFRVVGERERAEPRLAEGPWGGVSPPVFWEVAARPGPEVVAVAGGEVRKGSRVRLRPRPGADIFDLALAGRVAVVEGIDEELEGKIHLAVTLEDDPGRDLGEARQPGHRFFFSVDEVEVLASPEGAGERPPPRVLVAGIGNVFLGDDGFGVEVARQLLERPREVGVDVVDFGIRGVDLAYALQGGYAAAILVDAAPRGYVPGTLSVIEPGLEGEAALEPHGMDPVRVLRLAREMGGEIPPVRVVACEPERVQAEEGVEALGGGLGELSAPVRAAVETALELVAELVAEFRSGAWEPVPARASTEGAG